MSEMTQYRYWLERLKQISKTTAPTSETENSAKCAEYESAKSAKSGDEAAEIAWRVEAIRPQVPLKGPIPFLVARECAAGAGHCLSCGDTLAAGRTVRCVYCVLAIERVLNEAREAAGYC